MARIIHPDAKIIYAATPFRMQYLRDQICNFIESECHFPLHPLLALPLERYNYDRYSSELIYRACFGMLDFCDQMWIFGIGTGSFKEYERAKEKGKEVRSFVRVFDPQWKEYSKRDKYKINFPKTLEEVLRTSENKDPIHHFE